MNRYPVTVLIHYRALPGKEDLAAKELSSLIATVVSSEPDCGGIKMLQDESDRGRILLHELWTSKEAYLGPHMQTPHLQAFIGRGGELFAAPPEISFWQTVAASAPPPPVAER